MYSMDPFQLKSGKCNTNRKPLFEYFILFGSNFVYMTKIMINFFNFILYGPLMIKLFDSSCFFQVYRDERKGKLIFYFYIAMYLFEYVTFMFERYGSIWLYKLPSIDDFSGYLCFFCTFMQNFFLHMCIHYYQHGTRHRLNEITEHLTNVVTFEEETRLIEEIINLAIINNKLGKIISLPFIGSAIQVKNDCQIISFEPTNKLNTFFIYYFIYT